MPEYKHTNVCLNSYGVSVQTRAYYEKLISRFFFTEKILLNHFWSFHVADKCRPSISVRKTTTMSEKKLTTQLALLKYA